MQRDQIRVFTRRGLLLSIVLMFAPMGAAIAQVYIPDNAVDAVLLPFITLSSGSRAIAELGQTLFWSLLTIEMLISGFTLFWSGADFGQFGKWLVERMLIIGFMIYLFQNGPWLATIIRWTLESVGVQAGGVSLNPANIIEKGVEMAGQLVTTISWWDGPAAIPVLLTGLLMVIIFAFVGANMVVVMCEVYLLVTIGAFLLGFAGSSWTRDYAVGYLRYTLAVAFKLAAMQVLVGLGLQVIEGWVFNLTGDELRSTSLFTLIATMLVFYALTNTLPGAAADMVRGHGSSGGFGGVGSAGQSIVSNMRSASSSVSSAAGALTSASSNLAKTTANLGMAAGAAGKIAQADGAKGPAAVVAGAAGNMAKAAAQEVGKSVRGINGPMSSRQSMSQKVNRNLSKQANK